VATVKITVELEDGSTAEFFKKVYLSSLHLEDSILTMQQGASGSKGLDMMKGTFEAERTLYDHFSERVPKPIGWGEYSNKPETYFYMSEFVEMYDDLPSATDWAGAVSGLHIRSMGKSPTGQFGFHVPTHLANVPVNNAWQSSWKDFWAQQMKSLFDREKDLNGSNQSLETLRTAYMEKAIPRFLGPLQSEGRSIEPCLIHSDLWPGNIKPKVATDELCVFDACAYWGHNEGSSCQV
jgi:protein-ribulosamine 3-kinase